MSANGKVKKAIAEIAETALKIERRLIRALKSKVMASSLQCVLQSLATAGRPYLAHFGFNECDEVPQLLFNPV